MNILDSAFSHLQHLADGTYSSVELVAALEQQYERLNPQINAISTANYHQALTLAAESNALREKGLGGPLNGLPVTIKDGIHVKGLPSTGGISPPEESVQADDAPVVERLRQAGALIVGKTNTPAANADWQANNPIFGRTLNPWNTELTPGGSTGGGAAAVAAGLSPLEFGSDIGGSIRIPAAFCGIYGHKPSATVVPHSGHFPNDNIPNPAQLQGVQGPLARSAEDLDLALDIIAGPESTESGAWQLQLPPSRHRSLADFRVAILPDVDWAPVDREILDCRETLIGRLIKAGTKIVDPDLKPFGNWQDGYCKYLSLLQCFMGTGLEAEQKRRAVEKLRGYGNPFYDAIAAGLSASAERFQFLLMEAERYKRLWAAVFRDVDIIIAPVTLTNAFPHMDEYLYDRKLTVNGKEVLYPLLSFLPSIATFPGLPATAFPAGKTTAGIPIGLQAIGPYLEDRTTIQFARLVEQAVGGYTPPPMVEQR